MAVTIAETSGHVTETELKSPLSPPVTMRRNDRSHSPKYASSVMLVQGAIKQVQGQRLVPELNRHALDLMLSTSQPGTGSNPNV